MSISASRCDPRPNNAAPSFIASPETPASTLSSSGAFSYLPLRLIQYSLLFVSAIIVTRELGPVGRAQYALPLALAGIVWVVTNLSLELASSRMLARREITILPLTRVLSLWLMAMSVVATAIAFGLGSLLREEVLAGASVEMVLVASLTIPALFATQLSGQLLFVRGRLIAHGLASASGAVLQLVVTLYLLATDNLTASTALATAAVGFGVVGLLLVVALARDIGKGALIPRPDRRVLRRLIAVGARLHPGSVALQLDPRLSLILVGALLTASDAGVYSLALSLMGTVLLVIQSLSLSAVHTQYKEVEVHATSYTLEFARQSFLLSLIGAALMAVIAYPMIMILYGSAFAEATLPFITLLLATVAVAIENPCRVLLTRSPLHSSSPDWSSARLLSTWWRLSSRRGAVHLRSRARYDGELLGVGAPDAATGRATWRAAHPGGTRPAAPRRRDHAIDPARFPPRASKRLALNVSHA